MGMVGACGRASQKSSPSSHEVARADSVEQSAPDAQGSSAHRSPDQVITEASAIMTEYMAHMDGVVAIIREHGKDCDLAAKHLDARVDTAGALGLALRIKRLKKELETLPEPERERVDREGERAIDRFKARNPDHEAIMQTVNECQRTSSAFAAVAPKGLFGHRTKK